MYILLPNNIVYIVGNLKIILRKKTFTNWCIYNHIGSEHLPLSVGLLSDLCPESKIIWKVAKLESMVVANKKLFPSVFNFADQAISTEQGPIWNGADTLAKICAH